MAPGPPPNASATAKLVRQSAKISIQAPGSTARSIGHSMLRWIGPAPMPSEAPRRKRSAGIESQPCSTSRTAKGRLKKTCARITPCAPKGLTSSPRGESRVFTAPDRPKTATMPRTATMVGRMKGAPISVITRPRPAKRRRASARATGTASATESVAERAACQSVNHSASPAAGPMAEKPSARHATAASVPSVSARTSAAARPASARVTG